MTFLESALALSLRDWALVLLGVAALINALRRPPPPPPAAAPPRPRKKDRAKGKEPEGAEAAAVSSDSSEEEGEEEEEEKPLSWADLAARARAVYVSLGPKQQLGGKVGAGVLALVLAYLLWGWLLGGGRGSPAAPVDGLSPVNGLRTPAAWYKVAHYYTLPNFLNREGKQVPYVACQHYDQVEAVHAALLGPKAPSVVTDTVTEHGVDHVRERALKRCVLEEWGTLLVDFHATNHSWHVKRAMPWDLLGQPNAEWLADTPVRYMFLTRRGARYFRVVALSTGPKGNQRRLEPFVVSETELLDAAHNWYHEMIMDAGVKEVLEDRPCLCDAHLGIYNSGLGFTYDAEKHAWALRLDVGVSRPLTKFDETTPIKYRFNFDFPFKVDQTLRFGTGFQMDPAYHGHVEITYIDPGKVAAEMGKRQMLQGLDEPNDALGLAGVVDLAALGLVPERAKITDTDCDCVHYCLALTQAIQRRLVPAAVATTRPYEAEL
jgi:hypothetical protein